MCVSPYIATRKDGSPVCVPCGKCIECLKDYQNEWVFRLTQEIKRCSVPIFLTLTYNDDNLPLGDIDLDVPFPDTELSSQSVLCKRDLQLFFKRLRKNGGSVLNGMRYFAIGEHGSKYNRCHYHAVIIAPGISSVSEFNKILEKSWKLGFYYAKFCTSKQIHYVCKYMNKIDKRPHLVKPFRLYSRSIGLNYLTDKIIDYYLKTFDRTCLNGKYRIGLPRYYRRKLDDLSQGNYYLKKAGLSYSDLLEEIKPKLGTHFSLFKEFEDNFELYYRQALAFHAHQSQLYGYQSNFELTRQEVFQVFVKSHKLLSDILLESNRIIMSQCIRNKLDKLRPVSQDNESLLMKT